MKKIWQVFLLVLCLVCGSVLGYVVAIYTAPEVAVPEVNATEIVTPQAAAPGISMSDLSMLIHSDFADGSQLRIVNFPKLLQASSAPVACNEDPGSDPPEDYFGILALQYPLREMDIADTDKIVITIQPYSGAEYDDVDLYIACDTEAIKQVKDELCYFSTPTGMTPVFYVSIYKNDFLVELNGSFGMHMSALADDFKPLTRLKEDWQSDVVIYMNQP